MAHSILHLNLVIERSHGLYPYSYLVISEGTTEDKLPALSLKQLEIASVLSCSESRIVMFEGDQFLIKIGIFILFPSRNRVFLEEKEAMVPAHFLSGVDQWLTARQSKVQHCHSFESIPHPLEFGSRPRVLIVIRGKTQTHSIRREIGRILFYIGCQFLLALLALCDIIQQVVQFPSIGSVESANGMEPRVLTFSEEV